MERLRHFGPMHGERSRRHQFTTSVGRPVIVTLYEIRTSAGAWLGLELMKAEGYGAMVAAELTPEEAGWLRDACAEFLVSLDGDPRSVSPEETR